MVGELLIIEAPGQEMHQKAVVVAVAHLRSGGAREEAAVVAAAYSHNIGHTRDVFVRAPEVFPRMNAWKLMALGPEALPSRSAVDPSEFGQEAIPSGNVVDFPPAFETEAVQHSRHTANQDFYRAYLTCSRSEATCELPVLSSSSFSVCPWHARSFETWRHPDLDSVPQ